MSATTRRRSLPPPTPERVAEFFEFLKARIATARKYAPGGAGLRAVPDAVSRRAAVGGGGAAGAAGRALRAGPVRQAACAVRQGRPHVRAAAAVGADAGRAGPGVALVPRRCARPKFPDSPVLFADESGGALHRGTIRNRLRYLMELEGRPRRERFSPHALRRACATHNYERGVDLVAIQQLLGHWTVSSTMRYVRPSATFIEDAYRRAVTATLSELTGEDGTA